jgi:hypothetical protein
MYRNLPAVAAAVAPPAACYGKVVSAASRDKLLSCFLSCLIKLNYFPHTFTITIDVAAMVVVVPLLLLASE